MPINLAGRQTCECWALVVSCSACRCTSRFSIPRRPIFLFLFTADKSMRKQWIIDRKSDQIQFTMIHCQLTALSLNLVWFTGKKGWSSIDNLKDDSFSPYTIASQVYKFLFSSWTSSYLCMSFL